MFVHVRANTNEHKCSLYMCSCSFIPDPEYELVKSALTDFDLSASDWNTGAEQDWVYGNYGDFSNYEDLIKYK